MLAHLRSCFLFFFLLALCTVACLPAWGQINGVPASVTSYGFGGSNNPNPGVRASVTSLGPNGYGNSRPIFGNCCANFFVPSIQNQPQFSGRRHHRGNHSDFPVVISEPVYVPYAIPYDQEAEDEPQDVDYVHAPGPRRVDPSAKHVPERDLSQRDLSQKADAAEKPDPVEAEEPVAVQPSTVLVFKDGHESDVVNYAIVGDTLFDFGAGRTHKILLTDLDLLATQKVNDDRGVDFQIPTRTTR